MNYFPVSTRHCDAGVSGARRSLEGFRAVMSAGFGSGRKALREDATVSENVTVVPSTSLG